MEDISEKNCIIFIMWRHTNIILCFEFEVSPKNLKSQENFHSIVCILVEG